MMETVSVKFQEEILQEIDRSIVEHHYNSRTEFIREAVREKLAVLSRDDLVKEFLKFRGKAKKKTSLHENKRTKELVSKELMTELDKRFR